MNKGNIFIISGPSGSGKDTVIKELLAACPDMGFSISCTTREKRDEDIKAPKYNFISKESFEKMLQEGELLEHNVFVNNYYGTPKTPVYECVNAGRDMLIEVDVNGAAQLRVNEPQAVSIFIMPPSLEVLRHRLSGRGTETADMIEKRLNEALGEIARAEEYDYIVVNDDLADAVSDALSIIKSRHLTLKNQKYLIDQILNK